MIATTMTRRVLELDTLAGLDAALAGPPGPSGWFVQGLDLTERSDQLLAHAPRSALFLGCTFAAGVEEELRRRGALVFPRLPELPFDPYRPALYDWAELYGDRRYAASPDAAIYAWSRAAPSLLDTLAKALHDHAVTDALDDATADLDPGLVVGVMGGHALGRDDPGYADAVRLGSALTAAGRTVLTGGGPGAMEAANLGGYLSPWIARDRAVLGDALAVLGAAPSYADGLDGWLAAAREVRRRWPRAGAGRSLSVPTWFYGHEPSNVFATGIAKYFANALREDTLLHRCRGGIVFLPGAAGTVQEIFQAATESFYAADAAAVAPLVLVGVDHWTGVLPAWPLLQELGRNRPMGAALACVETVDEAARVLLGRHPPDVTPAAGTSRRGSRA
jgi:predicted Rossmann-fold nucleotide-binding protein